jgi:hypothetical protein
MAKSKQELKKKAKILSKSIYWQSLFNIKRSIVFRGKRYYAAGGSLKSRAVAQKIASKIKGNNLHRIVYYKPRRFEKTQRWGVYIHYKEW